MEDKMISGKDIVIVGLQSWDITIGSNCKNIATELARHNRVLYVNRAPDRISLIRSRKDPKVRHAVDSLRKKTADLQQISDTMWTLAPRTLLESVTWIPFTGLFDYCNRVNNQRIATEINKATQQLGFSDIILFTDNDFFRAFYLPEMLQNISGSIYYIRDNLTSQPYFKKHGGRLERALMKKSTMVAANSAYLANYARQYNPASFDIGQGCDFDYLPAVSPSRTPDSIAHYPPPVIGYVGALTATRLSIPILEQIATQRPAWNIVLVGPEDDAFKNSSLHQLPNVHFIGSKAPAVLPAYIATFDVCINPQALNEMTIGNYPRKIDEYLAMGKPVVATHTETMQLFADYVSLCHDADGYITAIENILSQPENPEVIAGRKTFALSHTWANSVALMSSHYQSLVNQ
ncbi:glycosyltransferase [Chitinophaga nivalis]|uniref:Glycosyltransferase n=1 Tax=Chitinophaga nivalis TaxID=2991709 RepID=A0ABT3IM94_9BACT|nr:glycosyltransferase [Chitinophaga nivalis]MCW3465408.1 glycosyltransferase [Chitinophaga nivalis]MCW3484900.1 glycosyltransferase [Chitinophaga nivalis]